MSHTSATIDQIQADPSNVRADEHNNVDDLAQSIFETGLVQPIVLSPDNVIIAGHRRAAAIQQLINEKRVAADYEFPVAYRDNTGNVSSLQMMLVENLQREDLDPVEEAKGYARMVEDYSLKHAEIAERVGKSSATVSQRIRLLRLPDSALAHLSKGIITLEMALEFVPIADMPEEIEAMLLLKLAPWQIKNKVQKLLADKRIQSIIQLIDHHGGVGVSDYKAMNDFGIEVHMDGKSLTEPTSMQIEEFVNPGEIYKVSIQPHNGDVVIQETREAVASKRENAHSDKEKLARAAKRKRQAAVADMIVSTQIKAADVRPLLNNMMANMMGNNVAKLACRYMGITAGDCPLDNHKDPMWSQAVAMALDANGIQGIRAQVAVIAAYWESRHGSHLMQLDPTYGMILELLGIDLDPETSAPVEQPDD